MHIAYLTLHLVLRTSMTHHEELIKVSFKSQHSWYLLASYVHSRSGPAAPGNDLSIIPVSDSSDLSWLVLLLTAEPSNVIGSRLRGRI